MKGKWSLRMWAEGGHARWGYLEGAQGGEKPSKAIHGPWVPCQPLPSFGPTNVLKTESDRPVRPVEPSTGDLSGSIKPNEPFLGKTGIESVKPSVELPNWSNRPVFYEPAKLFIFLFYKYLLLLKGPLTNPILLKLH